MFQKLNIILAIVTIIFIFSPMNSFAKLYKWVDEHGVVHITDNPSEIPEKYRDKPENPMTLGNFITTFFCKPNSKVVSGDSTAEVIALCGEPYYRESIDAKETYLEISKSDQGGYSTTKGERQKSPSNENWYYNCGKQDFIYILEFKNAILEKITLGGRGNGANRCQ